MAELTAIGTSLHILAQGFLGSLDGGGLTPNTGLTYLIQVQQIQM